MQHLIRETKEFLLFSKERIYYTICGTTYFIRRARNSEGSENGN